MPPVLIFIQITLMISLHIIIKGKMVVVSTGVLHNASSCNPLHSCKIHTILFRAPTVKIQNYFSTVLQKNKTIAIIPTNFTPTCIVISTIIDIYNI